MFWSGVYDPFSNVGHVIHVCGYLAEAVDKRVVYGVNTQEYSSLSLLDPG